MFIGGPTVEGRCPLCGASLDGYESPPHEETTNEGGVTRGSTDQSGHAGDRGGVAAGLKEEDREQPKVRADDEQIPTDEVGRAKTKTVTTERQSEEAIVPKAMKRYNSGIFFLVLAGLACLSSGTGDPTNPTPIGLIVCLSCWLAAGFAFAGRRLGVYIVTVIILVLATILIVTNPTGMRANNPRGSIVLFLLNGGLAAILAIFASLAMRRSNTP